MSSVQDPPPPPLAADAALSAMQCQLASENLGVTASHMLSLIRTLRLSLLIMDQDTLEAEEEWQVMQSDQERQKAQLDIVKLEQAIVQLRRSDLAPSRQP
jgi:Surfeit locus protein 5 subunit 22 of Mediator complex